MKKLTIIFLVTLNSCGLLSKYEYGQHMYFKNSLTANEKKEIDKKGSIIKRWIGSNNLGDSLIGNILIKKNNPYEFIEIGDWKEKSMLTRNNNEIGNYIKELKYDEKGNLIFEKSYFKKRDSKEYFLIEEMESSIYTDEQKAMRETYKGFYDTGELQYQVTLRVTDCNTVKSDHLRKKEIKEPIVYFDKKGKELPYLQVNPYYGISKFTKMK